MHQIYCGIKQDGLDWILKYENVLIVGMEPITVSRVESLIFKQLSDRSKREYKIALQFLDPQLKQLREKCIEGPLAI